MSAAVTAAATAVFPIRRIKVLSSLFLFDCFSVAASGRLAGSPSAFNVIRLGGNSPELEKI